MTAEIVAATSADLDAVRRLFRDYEAEIGVDLCFQGFEQELADLPGAYAPPRGRLLIARSNGEAVGCVALRPLKSADEICEMKRLYVQPAMRSTGLGRQLVERIVFEARTAGYRAMRLDTLATMTKAQQMYRRLGFRDIAAYYPNPLPGVTYMELTLANPERKLGGDEAKLKGATMNRAIIDEFEAGGPVLRQAVAGLTPDELKARPGPGDWSIQEIVIHLADSDEIAIDRMKRIIIEDNPSQLWADETAYIQRLYPHEQSLEDALTIFEAGRRQFARVLRKLPDAAFERHGTHNKKGRVTLAEMVASYAGHVNDHMKFLLGKRERLGKPLKS